jgi:hypothetical protein
LTEEQDEEAEMTGKNGKNLLKMTGETDNRG